MQSIAFICGFLVLIFGVSANLLNEEKHLVDFSDIYYINPISATKYYEMGLSDVKDVDFKGGIKLLLHGYLANRNHPAIAPIRNAYLSKGQIGLIIGDWRDASSLFYPVSRHLIKPVGVRFSKILHAFLRKHGIDPVSVHIIGHSLGAHMAGIIGRYFNGTIGRITGLDPASPLFNGNCADCLTSSAAKFVDVIHTDIPIFGDSTPRGHVDFYPNDGSTPQPGCNLIDIITATSCSHYRAPLLFAESVRLPDNFPSVNCPVNYILELNGRACMLKNWKRMTLMGEAVPRNARGTFYLETSYRSPYGMGDFSQAYAGRFTHF